MPHKQRHTRAQHTLGPANCEYPSRLSQVIDELKRRIDLGESHLIATHAIITVFQAYLSSWLSDRTVGRDPLNSVEEAAFVLAFVMHWRFHIVSTPGLTLQANFLTRETFLDIVTSCHGCILRFPQFRDNWGGKFKPDGPRFTSAYSEYFFQYGRMAQTNSPVVSVLGWWRHLKHYLYQQFAEADWGGSLPASCRGIPHTIDLRLQPPHVPADWHATDAQLIMRVDRGVERACQLLQGCGVDTSTARLRGFFARPCKHYPLSDTYITSAACEEADTGDKEDDPCEDSGGETVAEAGDAADAEAVLAQLMRQGLGQGDGELRTKDGKNLLEAIGQLLRDFNQSIQEESKDRKYRFVVKKLMKAHQRAGDTLDTELDYYRDDDDVAVLFFCPDGTKVWCLGNLEEVARTTGTVDERRAISDRGADYLLGLDKVYKPDGVFIDDPQGVFVLRWYKEVDRDGKELNGYQNKGCVGYKLMENNDLAHFTWTSNVQLISKVYLKPHVNGKWHTLNTKDKKMVSTAITKKI
jgi:hypothetical protein